MPRLYVVKRGGARQEFSREKVLNSMLVACGKRPVPLETVRAAAERVEKALVQIGDDEISSSEVGEYVMRELRQLDMVAYVRFASVYKEFETITDFREIVESVNSVQNCAGQDVVASQLI